MGLSALEECNVGSFIGLMMALSALALVGVAVAAVGEWKAAGRKGADGVGLGRGSEAGRRGATRVKGSFAA